MLLPPSPEEKESLALSCFNGNLENVEKLLWAGIDPNKIEGKVFIDDRIPLEGSRLTLLPLLCASHEGHLEIVKLLVDSGAIISTRGICGRTARMIAIERGHREVASFLESIDPNSLKHRFY